MSLASLMYLRCQFSHLPGKNKNTQRAFQIRTIQMYTERKPSTRFIRRRKHIGYVCCQLLVFPCCCVFTFQGTPVKNIFVCSSNNLTLPKRNTVYTSQKRWIRRLIPFQCLYGEEKIIIIIDPRLKEMLGEETKQTLKYLQQNFIFINRIEGSL